MNSAEALPRGRWFAPVFAVVLALIGLVLAAGARGSPCSAGPGTT